MDTKLSVLGMGWATPHGRNLGIVWKKILAEERPALDLLPGPFGGSGAPVFRVPVPEDATNDFGRLRRASAISHFACMAAADAVANAGPLPPDRTALIFATSNGGVVYTRKFYADVVERGAGSPLLFPETVHNAPASHVAARFSLNGPALTFVSDATAGIDALRVAAEMIQSAAVEVCLVVAAEEADWTIWDACRRWDLARSSADSNHGAVLSEGAVALVVGRAEGALPHIERVHPGISYHRSCPMSSGLQRLFRDLSDAELPELAIISASGTRADRIENRVLDMVMPGIRKITPKKYLGEAFAASTLAQVVCGLLAIRDGLASRVIISVAGWSGQLGGLVLTR